MFRVVEAFSGIGSQAKALKNIGIPYKIVATIDWDINALYAYDIIHHGFQDLSPYENLSKKELLSRLSKYSLSVNGKKPTTTQALKMYSEIALKKILCAIERSNNLVSIVDVSAKDIPDNIDLLTYSFPCQDLSICGAWHGNNSGIDRNAHNRSGMLWEVERILKEYEALGKKLPKFLLMENVSNILSEQHRHNFEEWKNYLRSIGYYNKVYTLNSSKFGIPQTRIRTYMLSVLCKNDKYVFDQLDCYFKNNDLEKFEVECPKLDNFLRTNYTKEIYKKEADISNPNDTPSRQKIYQENDVIYDGYKTIAKTVNTITTKQDRNPNSGLLKYLEAPKGKAQYRNLTPRECFLLMGFDEKDYQILLDNDFELRKKIQFCTREKLIRVAGNSIVVNVLEQIFKQLYDIEKNILNEEFLNHHISAS